MCMCKHETQSKQPHQNYERMHCLITGLGILSQKIKRGKEKQGPWPGNRRETVVKGLENKTPEASFKELDFFLGKGAGGTNR